MLMLSGVLKLVVDRDPSRRFHLVRRTGYTDILKGHPAIDTIGFPPPEAEIVGVDYWSMEKIGPGERRPFQILARAFGLETPVEETLYVCGDIEDDAILHEFLPWKERNVLIAPSSDSPRKTMHPSIWHRVVDYLLADGFFVMQAGRMNERHIRNAYSVLGLTTPRQLISLVRRCDAVITSDNFIMHAAHLAGTPAVALWGPTDHEVYGYPEQLHIQAPRPCEFGLDDECIGPARNEGGRLYGTPCPHGRDNCMDRIAPESVYDALRKLLTRH